MSSRKCAHTQELVLGGAALLIAIGIARVFWLAGGWQQSGDLPRGKPAQSTTAIAGSEEIRNRVSQARQTVGEGRYAKAFDLYRQLDGPFWSAEDCFALGSALIRRDRIALGWGALEAARRIDPKHAETLAALEAIQARFATAAGQERDKLHEAARRVEFMRAISGGPPLGLLVLGLARFAGDSDQEDEFLDRLGARDRVALRGAASVSTATKLVARLLLEAGRAMEAYTLLDPLISSGSAHADHGPQAPAPDRETAWLLSRAALQLDRHKVADAMLALAGDSGKRASFAPEPAPFVGSKSCGECHSKIYRDQQEQSRHAMTLRLGAALKDVPLPAHPVPDPVSPEITHELTRKGDDRIELESRGRGQVARAIVEYAVGSGRHGITMVARDGEDLDRQMRVSYFAEKESWGMTKGIDFAPHDEADFIGVVLTRSVLSHCLGCHTTWFRAVDQNRSGPRRPEGEDRGVGCERCHGPGLNHVKAARSGYADAAIALTANAPSSVRLKSCVECHAADGSVESSDPEFTRAQGTTFLFSRCFTASKDRFGCTTCHDPHRSVDTTISHYESKCLGCHGATASRTGTRATAQLDRDKAGAITPSCPVNATGECISCHMPKVYDPSRRSWFTDHHIRVHRTPARAHVSSRGPPVAGRPGSPRALSEKERSAMIEEERGPSRQPGKP